MLVSACTDAPVMSLTNSNCFSRFSAILASEDEWKVFYHTMAAVKVAPGLEDWEGRIGLQAQKTPWHSDCF